MTKTSQAEPHGIISKNWLYASGGTESHQERAPKAFHKCESSHQHLESPVVFPSHPFHGKAVDVDSFSAAAVPTNRQAHIDEQKTAIRVKIDVFFPHPGGKSKSGNNV